MKLTKKKLAVAALALGLVGTTGFAYWTTTGTGTGTATAGNVTPVTITQVGTTGLLKPGTAAKPIDFKITNTNEGAVHLDQVNIQIRRIEGPFLDAAAGRPCTAADFTIVQAPAINADVAVGDTPYVASGATIQMINAATNQDGCKEAKLFLDFSVGTPTPYANGGSAANPQPGVWNNPAFPQ